MEDDVAGDDKTFRLMLIVVIAAFVPIALYFRIRSTTSEKLDRWQEGPFILFGLRMSGLPMLIGGVAWMINPRWMDWSSIALPVWLRWVGVAIAACSGMLLVWAFGNLGRNLTDTVVTRKVHTLITTGPYRYVRHPFYLAVALGVAGWSLVMANWFILLSGAMVVAFQIARTRIEEEKLVERFGVEYQDYMRRVGRFVPHFKPVG